MNGLSPCSMEQARRSDVVSGALTVMDYAVFCTDMQMNMSVIDVVFENRIKAILVVVVTINAERATVTTWSLSTMLKLGRLLIKIKIKKIFLNGHRLI